MQYKVGIPRLYFALAHGQRNLAAHHGYHSSLEISLKVHVHDSHWPDLALN